MVPVYMHRYLPAGRGTHGHPVLSMWQTDVTIYGTDIADYVDQEFGTGPGDSPVEPGKMPGNLVPFWSDFIGNFRSPRTLAVPG